MVKLLGERPVEGTTPDSLLALHSAGYRELRFRLGPGLVLDAGCGLGFESASLLSEDRVVVGFDYDLDTARIAGGKFSPKGLRVTCCDALSMCFRSGAFDFVCSSHLIEHFHRPALHAAELARVLSDTGTALILTPNRPADFENPFHLHLYDPIELEAMLRGLFDEVWVGGLDGSERVKSDFTARRQRAEKVLRVDVFNLRRRIPHKWYTAIYSAALPIVYRLMASGDSGGATGITADDFHVTEELDDTTLVLFAVCRSPKRDHAAD